MSIVLSVILHPIVLSCFFGWFVAQLAKFVIGIFADGKVDMQLWVTLGGMPSSHAAFVSSLAAAIYFLEGLSTAFFVSVILAIIVIRDAMGVRMVVEELSREMDKIAKHKRRRRVGHTPLQITVGTLIGIAVAIAVHYILIAF